MNESEENENNLIELDALLSFTPVPIVILKENQILKVTPAAVRLFGGKRKEDVVGKNFFEFTPHLQPNGKKTGDLINQIFGSLLKDKEVSIELKMQDSKSVLFSASITFSTLSFLKEKTIMAVIQDITQLKELKRRNEMMIEKNPGLMFLVNPSLQVIEANKTWEEISGYTHEELISMKISDFKVFSKNGGDVRDSFSKGLTVSGELGVDTPKGLLYLNYYYVPLPEEDGSIKEVLAVYFDTTSIIELDQHLKKSIQEIAETLSSLSQRNISVNTPVYTGDPLLEIKNDLNRTIFSINEVLSLIYRQTEFLELSITNISRATGDLASGSQQVAEISQESANDMTTELSFLNEISGEITDLSASIEEITANAQGVQNLISEIAKAGNEAVDLGNDATGKMKVVEEISKEATGQIIELNERIKEVGKIVQLIAGIANQTSLLALNAAIEAARAGEYGRGFAIVAGEVKSLAGEAKKATNSIDELISSLMQGSEKTASSMKKAYEAIFSGTGSVSSALFSLNKIAGDIEVAAANLSEITRATENQADGTNRVTTKIEQVRVMIAEEEKKMTGLAAVAEESSAATMEISRASGEINKLALELKGQVSTFTLSD